MNLYEISIRPHTQMIARAAIVAMILIANRVIRRLLGIGYRHSPDELEVPL